MLELGGSDPFIVLDTDDLDAAAETAWAARMEQHRPGLQLRQADDRHRRRSTTTSSSSSPRRCAGLTPGDPIDADDGASARCPREAAAETLAEQVEDAVDKGATLHAGGEPRRRPGAYFTPTVLTGVTPEMRAYREELFGPVAVVYKVADDDEAVALANDTTSASAARCSAPTRARRREVADRLEVGMVYINDARRRRAPSCRSAATSAPASAASSARYGIDEFVNKKLIRVSKAKAPKG